MLEFGEMLIDQFGGYSNPAMKLSREVASGKIHRLRKGLYETSNLRSIFGPAQVIYGPSYISFETALCYYGIIPEFTFHVTSATFKKHKDKEFRTEFCTYYSSDVPADVFPFETEMRFMDGYTYRIATREKAVCDKLYKMPPVADVDELGEMMFDDLRFYEDDISELSYNVVTDLSERYGSKNIRLLSDYLGGLC